MYFNIGLIVDHAEVIRGRISSSINHRRHSWPEVRLPVSNGLKLVQEKPSHPPKMPPPEPEAQTC